MKITFLGTSDSIPTANRNHPSMLLTYKGENILVDCGEGTQRQFRKARLNPCKTTKILISHWHTDHTLGLPGLLKTLSLSGYNKNLEIYGPKGIKQYIKSLLKLYGDITTYKIEVKEVSGKFFENKDFILRAEKMTHGIPCNAYTFEEKNKIRINKEKLKKSGLKEGPHLSKLKEGKDIKFEDKKYKAKDYTFIKEGKKVSFVMDTSKNKRIVPFVKNSDVLITESSFSEADADKARDHDHLTVKQAASIAKESKSKKLFLVHISQRYMKDKKELLAEAKSIFKETNLAKDLDVVEIE